MRFVCYSYFVLLLCIVSPVPALAAPAITCHCFTERAYDPARPALADPYFLATTQNSFFAAAFAVDKKTIVMKKQQGIASAELWIAYWLAARSGADPESLLQARKTKGSWRQVAAPLRISAKTMGGRFSEALQANAADDRLADTVVDELLLRFRFYGEAELTALRKAGAGNQELIISAMVAFRTRQPASQFYREVKSGSTSWGALLDRAIISPAEIEKEMNARISRFR
jgi:hypothetical protein